MAHLVTALETVIFLQFSSYWVLLPSRSIRWKLLLQLPVTMALLSADVLTWNQSKIASFSTISLSFDFRPSCRITVFTGFFVFATSQILTVRQSRLTIYFPFRVNSADEILDIKSIRQFLDPEPIFRQVELFQKLDDCLMSDIFNDPLLIPTTIRLSLLGCIEAQLMVYFESDLELAARSQTKQGRFASSKSHMKI